MSKLKEAVQQKEMVEVNDCDKWRIPYLCKLLGHRQKLTILTI